MTNTTTTTPAGRRREQPRHEPCGDGIRRDHRTSCTRTGRCDCPYSYWLPTQAGKRRRASVHGTLADARRAKQHAYEQAAQQRRQRQNQLAGAEPVPTLDVWFNQLMERQWSQTRIPTRERRRQDYERRIGPQLGQLRIDRITTQLVEAWLYDHLATDGNRRCVQRAHETLRLMLDLAATRRLIPVNPVREVAYPTASIQRRDRRVLTMPECHELLDACRGLDERCMVRLLTEAGLRIGEAIALQAGDLDLDADQPTITVQRRAYITKSGERDIDLPKSRKARVVAINAGLADDLRQHLAGRAGDDALVLTRCSSWTAGKHLPHTDSSLRNSLYRLTQRAGLGKVSPHGLRATGATIAAHAGTPHVVIQAHLGHSRIQTTERYIGKPDLAALGGLAGVFG